MLVYLPVSILKVCEKSVDVFSMSLVLPWDARASSAVLG